MKLNKIILTVAAAGLAMSSFAQKKGKAGKAFEGKITYEIVYEELPEMLEPYRGMLPKETITYIKGEKVRVEQNTMGSNIVNVVDNKAKTGFMLMDQFGEKAAYVMESKDFETDNKKGAEDFDVTYTKETKEIAGYTCTKAEIKNKKDGTTATAWVTDKISGSNKQYSFLKGFALEYTVSADMGMSMVMKAKTIDKIKVADSYFQIPEGYAKKKMSDLQDQMKQMQGEGEDD